MAIHHRIVIIGGGNAGISVAARLRNKGQDDIAVIEPSDRHYYQPLWTMVGGGQGSSDSTVRPQASVMPQGVAWIKGAAEDVDPEKNEVRLVDGTVVAREVLTVQSRMVARAGFLTALGLAVADHPGGMGVHLPVDAFGRAEVPGVWAAGRRASKRTTGVPSNTRTPRSTSALWSPRASRAG